MSVVGDLAADRAQEQPGEATSSPRADNEEIRPLRCIEQRTCSRAFHEHGMDVAVFGGSDLFDDASKQ